MRLADILRLEPRAFEIFGEAWIMAVLKAGRGLEVGSAAAQQHPSNCALNKKLPNNIDNRFQEKDTATTGHSSSLASPSMAVSRIPGHFFTPNPQAIDFIPGNSGGHPANWNHQANSSTDLVLAGSSDGVMVANPTNTPSAHYRGDLTLVENHSANIPVDQSTSLYIRGLPDNITIRQILAAIRNTGRVYSLFLNPPTPQHPGSAAKLSFFTRAAAEKFYNATRAGFWVDGRCAIVVWNRVLVAEHIGGPWRNASRVVIIRGPREIANMEAIASIVHNEIRLYDLDKVYETDYEPIDGFVELEMHFGSFRAQAHSAVIVLNRILRGRGVSVSYGVDPCE